jgi:hypothetical protein
MSDRDAPDSPTQYDEKNWSDAEKRGDPTTTRGADIKGDTENILPEGSIDPIYQAKAKILNDAFQEIGQRFHYSYDVVRDFSFALLGMGKYPWFLFVVTGFGTFIPPKLAVLRHELKCIIFGCEKGGSQTTLCVSIRAFSFITN